MIWDNLKAIFGRDASERYGLPVLRKPYGDVQQQQQLGQQPVEKEFCSRMVFKLTPKYSSQLQARVRWLKVLQAAQQPIGGSWDLNFHAAEMTPRRLQQLASIIDSTFLNGSFAEVCGPSYVVQDSRLSPDEAGACDKRACRQAVAGFEPSTNSVIFYRPSWRKQPSLRCPLQADGVYCTNKLSWLLHTLGHEMVHCIVHHACPAANAQQAYQNDYGHGPIFRQLNKHIFGHHTTRFKSGWGRLHPRLHVESLQVSQDLQHGGEEVPQGQHASSLPPQLQREQHQRQGGPITGSWQEQWHHLTAADILSARHAGNLPHDHDLQQHHQQMQASYSPSSCCGDGGRPGPARAGSSYADSKLAAVRTHFAQRQRQDQLEAQPLPGVSGGDSPVAAGLAAVAKPKVWWSW